jgi:hypothetical protein
MVEVAGLQLDTAFSEDIGLFGLIWPLQVRNGRNSGLEQRLHMGLAAEGSVFDPYKLRRRLRLVSDQALISRTRLVTDQD